MLDKKVALITGASRGIGKEIAKVLAQNGATCIINYSGNEELANETAKEIQNAGGIAIVKKADVSNSVQCKAMIDEIISEFGKIDILINNAGITKDGLLVRMKDEDFEHVIDVNLKGTFNCLKYASKYMMKKKSGAIVNVSSVSGVVGNIGQSNYSASKAGVIGLTKSSAKELAGRNIRVNAIAPGFIQTDMTDILSDDVKQNIMNQIPLKRFGDVNEVAQTVLFLVSDMANYITGQVLNIDGGMVM